VLPRLREILTDVVRPARWGPSQPLTIEAHHVHGEPIAVGEALARPFQPFAVGDLWGPAWDTTWFRLRGVVPGDWRGEPVALRFDNIRDGTNWLDGEALLWWQGAPYAGLCGQHPYAVLLPVAHGGEQLDLLIEASSPAQLPGAFGGEDWPLLLAEPHGQPGLRLVTCEVAVRRPDVVGLAADWDVLLGVAEQSTEPADRDAAVHSLAAAAEALDVDDVPGTAAAARRALGPALARRTDGDRHLVTAVGHAHIDTAWLWPLRETMRKCARTLATAAALMDDFADYRFVVSAPRHVAWVREQQPELYARLVERVERGQLVPVGAMWVEADCNLPSGESLVRQLVRGKRWWAEHLGVDSRELWLPDGFGFPASLPQIMAAADVRWFLTQKLSWNDTNRFPHHSFWWEGIDGTRVLAHFPPADTYCGDMSVQQLVHGECRSAPLPASLYPFGHGDGGGGPTREMLEAAERLTDLAGVPRVRQATPAQFFTELEATADALPVFAGELYLEKHRGTFTSQAAVKRGNRLGEQALHAAELWSTLRPGDDWPTAELDRAWELLLTNQFHDILPGSAIHWVYADALRDHAEVLSVADAISRPALAAIAATVDASGLTEPVLIANPAPVHRREVIDVGQRTLVVDVPPLGYATVDAAAAAEIDARSGVQLGPDWVENQHLRLAWNRAGLLVSVFDKDADREVLAAGARGNLLQLHEDKPAYWDAWDIDRSYLDHVTDLDGPAEIHVVESGPLRAAVRFSRRFGRSRVVQTMVLTAGGRRVDFRSVVDWHEDHALLKVAFPVAVEADEAAYEIQFGHLRRSTRDETAVERARFEVCAQRWVDLSGPDFGVALLNDCKHGHDARGNVLRLSLLRAPTAPDPVCDRGRHEFTYALLPHRGDLAAGGVIAAGYALNGPLVAVPVPPGGTGPLSASAVTVDDPGFVVETVKRADDGAGVVLRGYEAHGQRRTATVRPGVPFRRAVRTDLLERELPDRVTVEGDAIVLELGPFELVTLLLR
jgi:alpha-mannosidase